MRSVLTTPRHRHRRRRRHRDGHHRQWHDCPKVKAEELGKLGSEPARPARAGPVRPGGAAHPPKRNPAPTKDVAGDPSTRRAGGLRAVSRRLAQTSGDASSSAPRAWQSMVDRHRMPATLAAGDWTMSCSGAPSCRAGGYAAIPPSASIGHTVRGKLFGSSAIRTGRRIRVGQGLVRRSSACSNREGRLQHRPRTRTMSS
jgi:hypothetical protein